MLRLRKAALHNGGAKDGSLPAADGLAGVGELVGRGTAWSQSLAVVADLDGNVVRQGPPHRHHLAAGGGNSRRLRRLLLLPATAGRKSKPFAERLWTMLLLRMVPGRVLLVVDDTPTQRYGPQVQGAGIHHNPTPGPADRKFLYGHIWVTISLALRHRLWQTIGLPLVGLLYVRAKDIDKIPPKHHWEFHTKLELAAQQVLQLAKMAQAFGKIVWVAADGAYAKRPFETVVSGWRRSGQPLAERRRLVRSATAPARRDVHGTAGGDLSEPGGVAADARASSDNGCGRCNGSAITGAASSRCSTRTPQSRRLAG